jgi:3-carboxy-cis,cis-muconate cycloisomerase
VSLLDPLFRSEALLAIFSDRARVGGMLAFEAALAQAEARAGVIPREAAAVIARCCSPEDYDMGALGRAARGDGNLAIRLVRELTARVAKAEPDAARYVHWGATSQDAIDTGFALQLRPALEHVESGLSRLEAALARLAESHRATPIAARTWLQHAVPTSFGLKVSGWLDAVVRHHGRLGEVRGRALVLQLGGAGGNLAALGERGLDVAQALAEELELPLPDLPWHGHRDRPAEVATALGLLAGTLGKIARDVALHAQTEIAELGEPLAEGRGGSTSMAHKQNPVSSAVALAAATRVPGLVAAMLAAMVQEDERGLGGWHAEWETLPEIVGLVGGALDHVTQLMEGLRVDAVRMGANLGASRGLVFAEAAETALAARLGRAESRRLVQAACRRVQAQGLHLREALAADPEVARLLPPAELAGLFDASRQLGVADRLIDRALASARRRARTAPDGGA